MHLARLEHRADAVERSVELAGRGRRARSPLPASGCTSPSSERSVVDLPAPFGPRKPVMVPGSTRKLSPATAWVVPKRLLRLSTSITRAPSRRRSARGVRRTRRRRCPARCRARASPSRTGTSTSEPMNAARMCVGAFSSPSSMCCQGQSSETIRSSARLEVAGDRGVGVLVDRDARRRVRDVDERGRGAVELAERRAHQLGDVDELAPLLRRHAELVHGAYPRQRERRHFQDRELDGYRAGADRFIAELDEEYYLHYAGLKPEFELARDLRAPRRPDRPRAGAAASARRWTASGTSSSSASAARATSAS